MDLKQKFIEENKFAVEEWFANKVLLLSIDSRNEIIQDLSNAIEYLPTNPIEDGGLWEQKIYGVIKSESIFYSIDYIKEEGEIPVIIDLVYVEADEYLDAILEKNTIKSYYGD